MFKYSFTNLPTMAINEWKIWIKLGFTKTKPLEKINIAQDLKQIENFLLSANSTVLDIQRLIKQFKNLRKQEIKLKTGKASKSSIKKNLESQIRIFDKILTKYEFFDIDEDISAARAKKIAKSLRTSAETIKINEKLLHKIKTDEKWTYNW